MISSYIQIKQENEKLKEENIHLNNIIKNFSHSNNSNISKDDKNSEVSKKEINTDNNNYNNLITYNINKNNNNNIINSNINHFENLNINQNNKEEDKLLKNPQESIKEKEPEKVGENESDKNKDKDKDKEKDKNKETERARRATRAFQRFKRANKSIDLSNKEDISKSDKISIIAKMLEGHLGNNEKTLNRESSVDVVYNKSKNEERFENNNNEIINIINTQPVISKKKKKMSCFSLET